MSISSKWNMDKQQQEKRVEAWNRDCPIGTPVIRFKLINPLREPQETKTRSNAWLMGGHTAMVMVEGVSGGVMVDSVQPRPVQEEAKP